MLNLFGAALQGHLDCCQGFYRPGVRWLYQTHRFIACQLCPLLSSPANSTLGLKLSDTITNKAENRKTTGTEAWGIVMENRFFFSSLSPCFGKSGGISVDRKS